MTLVGAGGRGFRPRVRYGRAARRYDAAVRGLAVDFLGDLANMTTNPSGILRRTALLTAAAAWWIAPAASAQSSAVAFGGYLFWDTAVQYQTFVQIAAGANRSAALRADGKLYTWGYYYDAPPTLPSGVQIVEIAFGPLYEGALARLSDGTLVAWSNHGFMSSPQPPQPPPGTSYVQCSLGGQHGLGLLSDGMAVGWADPSYAVYGQHIPPQPPVGVSFTKVVAGVYSSAGLLSDGTITVWGYAGTGLGNVTPLPAGVRYIDVALGHAHALALRSDGQVVAWGDNSYGQGNVPVLPTGITFTKIAAGRWHSLAQRSDGWLVAWGWNQWGQCDVPGPPTGLTYVQFAAGLTHGIALRSDGKVACWGAEDMAHSALPVVPAGGSFVGADVEGGRESWMLDSAGQVHGVGWLGTQSVPPPPPNLSYTQIAAGDSFALALRSDGTGAGWGDNSVGQCNVPGLPVGAHYTKLAAGGAHAVGLRTDGRAVAWGDGSGGATTIPPLPPGLDYVDVDAEASATALLRSDGAILVVGHSPLLVLGIPPPTSPPGLRIVDIALGQFHGIALLSDGTVVEWPNDRTPPPLPPGVSYVAVAAGYQHALARRSDGQLVAWGCVPSIGTECDVPTLVAGTSYLSAEGGNARTVATVGPESTYVTFANGCAGSRRATRLIPRDTPQIGKTLDLHLLDLPRDLAFVLFGFSDASVGGIPLPISLAPIGMPGCAARVSPDHVVLVGGSNGSATLPIPIPHSVGLRGLRFFNQAFVVDPPANALGAVASDAAVARIGG